MYDTINSFRWVGIVLQQIHYCYRYVRFKSVNNFSPNNSAMVTHGCIMPSNLEPKEHEQIVG